MIRTPQAKPIWSGFLSPLANATSRVLPCISSPRAAWESVKVASQQVLARHAGGRMATGCPDRRAPREGRILSASVEKRAQEKEAAAWVQGGGRPRRPNRSARACSSVRCISSRRISVKPSRHGAGARLCDVRCAIAAREDPLERCSIQSARVRGQKHRGASSWR